MGVPDEHGHEGVVLYSSAGAELTSFGGGGGGGGVQYTQGGAPVANPTGTAIIMWGASGEPLIVSEAQPFPVEIGQLLRDRDAAAVAQQTDAVMSGNTALTPKTGFADVAASTADAVIVAAVALKKIRVLAYVAHAGGTATNVVFKSKPAGASSAISHTIQSGANGGESPGYCPVGWFETVAGEALTVTTGAGSTTGVLVRYVEA